MPDDITPAVLIDAAIKARSYAYAPYSRFQVGAALLSKDQQIFTGCNIENASYGATICAERVACGTAIASDERGWQAIAIATVGGVAPCGVCRQFMIEFQPEMTIIMYDVSEQTSRQCKLADLLPSHFILDPN